MSNTEGKQDIAQNNKAVKFDAVKSEKFSARTVERSYKPKPRTEILGVYDKYEDMRVHKLTLGDMEQQVLGSDTYTKLYSADTGLNLLQRQKLMKALLKAMKQ